MSIIIPKTPEILIVSGPNGAGKSTFIELNKSLLTTHKIIQPDLIGDTWREKLKNAIASKFDIVLETTFNSNILGLLPNKKDYNTRLYQIYFNTLDDSWKRVSDRNEGPYPMKIDKFNVKDNFNQNFKNISQYFSLFDKSYFFDAIDTKLKMSFNKGEIVSLSTNPKESVFVGAFADYSKQLGSISEKSFKTIKEGGYINPLKSETPKMKFQT